MSSSSPPPHNFARYTAKLQEISLRTKTPLPSLVLSFAILHEFTAIAPLVAGFYVSRSLGVGEAAVTYAVAVEDTDPNWLRRKCRAWKLDGEDWAVRVGRRYGLFGFQKGQEHDQVPVAGVISDALFAYGLTKAILPLRIGASLYLSPSFSRVVLEPVRRAIAHGFRR